MCTAHILQPLKSKFTEKFKVVKLRTQILKSLGAVSMVPEGEMFDGMCSKVTASILTRPINWITALAVWPLKAQHSPGDVAAWIMAEGL